MSDDKKNKAGMTGIMDGHLEEVDQQESGRTTSRTAVGVCMTAARWDKTGWTGDR